METTNAGPQPPIPSTIPATEAGTTPPVAPAPPLNTSATFLKKLPLANKLLIPMVALFLVIILGSIIFYLFFISPKVATIKLIDELKPQVTNLKTSTKSVRAVMDKIHLITTEEIKQPSPVETSSPFVYPKLAEAKASPSILGTTVTHELSIIESAALRFSQETTGVINNIINSNKNIAGAETAKEDIFTEKLRSLKDEAIKADEYITKAQTDLTQLLAKTASPNKSIPKYAQGKIATSQKIAQRAKPYFDEAKKIAAYYKTISDVLITMNTKINSFKVSVASTGLVLDSVEPGLDIKEMSTKMSQAQVFLDQAKKDTEEIKKLSETLKNMTGETLPKAADDYHQHNVKVLGAVTDYFTSTASLVQSLITATNVIVSKAQQNQLTPGDSRMYLVVVMDISSTGQKADAQFVSDLQTLLGEETTLTLSFWQNNTLASTGSIIEAEIDTYDKILNKLREDNKLPVLTK